jgi:glycogen debranching enzyme
VIGEARARSLDLLRRCATGHGFIASSDFAHYTAVWARDACIAGLGAVASDDPILLRAAIATLDTLARAASPLGQIPAVVRPAEGTWDWAEGGAVDTTAWFVILAGRVCSAVEDKGLVARWWPAVVDGMRWLAHQDVTGTGLLSAAPSTDWMDAALTRSGRTLNLNALYAWAAAEAGDLAGSIGVEPPADVDRIRRAVDAWFWPDPDLDVAALYPFGFSHQALRVAYREAGSLVRRHYASHIVHAGYFEVCDVLANLIAIVGGVASPVRARAILDHFAASNVTWPYPSRSLEAPVGATDRSSMLVPSAEKSISERWQNAPGRYHNGAVWPFIGGFHALAEARAGRVPRAVGLLERVAQANSLGQWSFPEWIDEHGAPHGARHQAWNAGSFLLAAASVRETSGTPGSDFSDEMG